MFIESERTRVTEERIMSTNEPSEPNVLDFRDELVRQQWDKRRKLLLLVLGGLFAGVLGGVIGINWPFGSASAEARTTHTFGHCGMVRKTCVVDGDTIWLEGVKIRVADIDTPEISQPRCDYEYELGIKARDRLVVLLNQGEFSAVPIGNRDEDQYGRKLRVLMRDGRSLGDQLVAEGLARTWTGRREPWC
jgi:micrococcal nuclease